MEYTGKSTKVKINRIIIDSLFLKDIKLSRLVGEYIYHKNKMKNCVVSKKQDSAYQYHKRNMNDIGMYLVNYNLNKNK